MLLFPSVPLIRSFHQSTGWLWFFYGLPLSCCVCIPLSAWSDICVVGAVLGVTSWPLWPNCFSDSSRPSVPSGAWQKQSGVACRWSQRRPSSWDNSTAEAATTARNGCRSVVGFYAAFNTGSVAGNLRMYCCRHLDSRSEVNSVGGFWTVADRRPAKQWTRHNAVNPQLMKAFIVLSWLFISADFTLVYGCLTCLCRLSDPWGGG